MSGESWVRLGGALTWIYIDQSRDNVPLVSSGNSRTHVSIDRSGEKARSLYPYIGIIVDNLFLIYIYSATECQVWYINQARMR